MKTESRPDFALFDLIGGHRITSVIYTAVQLDIADRIADVPKSAKALAEETGIEEKILQRLLLALVTIGICVRDEQHNYSLTDIGSNLAGSAKKSLKAWALFEGEILYRSWAGLLDSVRTGQTASEILGVKNRFEDKSRDPEDIAIFNAAMVSLTRLVTDEVIAAYDFSGIGTLMDVGGGSGELIGAILTAYQDARGLIFDLPICASPANEHLQAMKLTERCQFIAGDFFVNIPPGADAIIMKSVLHDWNDERCKTIIRSCNAALQTGSKLIIVERLLPENPAETPLDRYQTLSDLNMLRGPGGSERTESAYEELLNAGGFRVERVLSAGRFGIIEALKN